MIERLSNWARRRPYLSGDLVTFTLLAALMLTAAGAVVASGWAGNLSQLIAISLTATFLGMLLSRSHYSEFIALLMTSVYGFAFVSLLSAAALPSKLNWYARYTELVERLLRWFVAVFDGEASRDEYVFAVFVATLFWYLGHNAAWHTFRLNRLYRAVIPPGAVLLVNNLYYDGPRRLDGYLLAYGFWVLLLAVVSHLQARLYTWRYNGLQIAGNTGRPSPLGWLRSGLMLALALVVLVTLLPPVDPDALADFQNEWLDDPLGELESRLADLTDTLTGRNNGSASYFDGEQLLLGGPVELGDDDVMLVQIAQEHSYIADSYQFYWRGRVYDLYDGMQWYAVPASPDQVPVATNLVQWNPFERFGVLYKITWMSSTNSMLAYAAQMPLQIGFAVSADRLYKGDQPVGVLNMTFEHPLRRGGYYQVYSLISQAGAHLLRSNGGMIPSWVGARYLQQPPTITQRTRDLTLQIVNQAGALTAYDQAAAVETWLRSNIRYNERVSPMPLDYGDFVDWVLFEQREGYCTSYASAMVVMLRSLGIPARVVGGFSQGEWDAESAGYVVREGDAHAWVEVFFPSYGWVEFEPTANRPLPPRVPPAPPTATPTPQQAAATITPMPETFGGAQTFPTPTATATPTPTPTPPPPVYPSPQPTPPPLESSEGDPSNTFAKTLLTLLLIVLLLIVGVPLAILALWWWVEVRGLGGLSPTAKAYARMYIYGRWLGVRPASSETPSERGRRLAQTVPRAARPIAQITEWYSVERYRRSQIVGPDRVKQTWAQARLVFIRQTLRRWLARRRGRAS